MRPTLQFKPFPGPWSRRAACRGMDPELFHPGRGAAYMEQTRVVKQVCADCPVQADCLDYGLSERVGIWGGLTEKERSRERRRRMKATA